MADGWRNRRERGSAGAVRLIVWLALRTGRKIGRLLLVPICAYFVVTAPQARRASIEFLSRAQGCRAGWGDFFRHLFVFATTLLDRIYLIHGRRRELEITVTNEPVFWDALAAGRGCLLLGSHLGSFEMLGIIGGGEKKLSINMVMHVDDDARLAKLILGSKGSLPYDIIPLGHPGSMLQVKECMEKGQVVGILADRVFADEATTVVPFLGHPARFSLSPLRLARITGVPVVTVFGLFRGGNRYEIVFELLADPVQDGPASIDSIAEGEVRPASAALSLDASLRKYVSILERQARAHPHNWFNFYDYWSM